VIAVSATGDRPDTVNEYLRQNGFTFPAAVGGIQGAPWTVLGINDFSIVDHYGVSTFPTNLILDRTGKILARIEGFDEAAIRAALKDAGVPPR
jgi:hypothetical protein